MTGKANQVQSDGEEARLQDLLCADAAAVIDDDLDEMDDEGAGLIGEGDNDSARATRRPRSQVYSIRVPVDRLEQVRCLAKERGVAPTAMLRDWVLRQLDSETGGSTGSPTSAGKRSAVEPREDEQVGTATVRLERAVAALMDVVTQLAAALAGQAEAVTAHRTVAGPIARSMPPRMDLLAASASHMALVSAHDRPRVIQDIAWLMPAAATHQAVYQHMSRGLSAWRSMVESTANWPGIREHDLDTLYLAADEELSKT